MKKILYVTYIDKNEKHHIGILKKVKYQKMAMEELGYRVDYGVFDTYNNYSINSSEVINLKLDSDNRRQARKKMITELEKYIAKKGYDIVYIRGESFDNIFLKFIKMLKRKNLKTILEIPTYPLKDEIKSSLKQKLKQGKYTSFLKICTSTLLMILSIPSYKKYIDLIVTYMDYKKIWNIDVCQLDNAIDCNAIKQKNNFDKPNELNLIGVANISRWHGFDRVIEGLYNYHGDCKIVFNIVGEGSETKNLKGMVKKYNLNSSINFLGMKDQEELDELFDKSHIAISSLGMHRINMINGSTLKTKEYCARGIPFILAYNEAKLDWNDNEKLYLQIPPNDSALDLNKVIDFYNNINLGLVSGRLRKFAIDNYSWKKEMKKVFRYIDNKKTFRL